MEPAFPNLENNGNAIEAFSWWEQKRLIYNLIIGLEGLTLLLIFSFPFVEKLISTIIVYGLIANVFYSIGFLLEMANIYYLKSKLNPEYLRWPLFVLGTLFSMLVTFLLVFAAFFS